MLIVCPKCKGSGEVIDKVNLIPIVGWLCAAFDGFWKECPRCDGECVIAVED